MKNLKSSGCTFLFKYCGQRCSFIVVMSVKVSLGTLNQIFFGSYVYIYLPLCLLWSLCGSEKNPVLLFSTLEPEWLEENIKSKITIWLTAVVSVQYVSLCPELQLETLHMCKYFKCSQKMALSACECQHYTALRWSAQKHIIVALLWMRPTTIGLWQLM